MCCLRPHTTFKGSLVQHINCDGFFRCSGEGCWIAIPNLPFWVHSHSTGPSFDALYGWIPLSISSHLHIVPDVLPLSYCGWPRTTLHLVEEGHNPPIVRFAYLWHMIGEEFVWFSFWYIKPFELGVEVTFNNQSTVTHHKVNLLKFPIWSSSF